MTRETGEASAAGTVGVVDRRPSLRAGGAIFITRVLSLVVALIFAVALSVISFFVLLFPVIAGYYLAVAQSRREVQFIDLANVFRTSGLVVRGAFRHFVGSIVLGVATLLPAVALLVSPVLVLEAYGEEVLPLALLMELLFFPAFYVAGSTLLFAFPALVEGRGFGTSIREAYSFRGARIVICTLTGFLLLFPIPGLLVHLLMIFTYPLIVSWAVSPIAVDPGPLMDPS